MHLIRYSYSPWRFGNCLVISYMPPGMFRAIADERNYGLADFELVVRHREATETKRRIVTYYEVQCLCIGLELQSACAKLDRALLHSSLGDR